MLARIWCQRPFHGFLHNETRRQSRDDSRMEGPTRSPLPFGRELTSRSQPKYAFRPTSARAMMSLPLIPVRD